jgi:DNA-binding SARP family transcriptional activator
MNTNASELQSAALTVQLLGPLQVCLHDCWLPGLRFRKSQWLLALLILRHGRPVEREWLSGMLWPERDDRQALRNSLANLRLALGPEAVRLKSPGPQTLAFDTIGVAIDVTSFDAALARGDAPALEEAVALYRGQLLEGCAEEWVFQERQPREQACLAALETLAALALTGGNATRAEGYLRRATALDPLRESTQRALMQILAAAGNYAAALQLYRELRQRLHCHLNAEPDPATQALFQQFRCAARCRSAGG